MTQGLPPVLVKTYEARSQSQAARAYAAEASALANESYVPTQQMWSGPRYARLVITPIILVVVGWLIGSMLVEDGWFIGLLIGAVIGVAYLFVARPKGALTVTYQRQQPAQMQQPYPPQQPPTYR